MDSSAPISPRLGQSPRYAVAYDNYGCTAVDMECEDASSRSSSSSVTHSEAIAQISVEVIPPYSRSDVGEGSDPSINTASHPVVSEGKPEILRQDAPGEISPVVRMVRETALSAPDGGLRPWASIFSCLCLLFLTSGMGKSFGSIKSAITAEMQCSHNVLMMIPGIFSAATLFWAPAAAAMIRCFGARLMLAVASLLCFLGFTIAGSADTGAYLVVCLGLIVGPGFSIVANYTVFTIGKLFKERKPLALALALSGGCIGHELLPRIFGPALQAFGPRGIFAFLAVGSALWILICLYIVGDPEHQMVCTVTSVPAPAEIEVPAPEEVQVSTYMKRLSGISEELGLTLLTNFRFWLISVSAIFFGLGNSAIGRVMSTSIVVAGIDFGEIFCLVSSVVVRFSFGILSAHSRFDRAAEYAIAVTGATIALGILILSELTVARWVALLLGAFCTGGWAVLVPATLGSALGAANIGKSFALVKLCRGLVMACWFVPKGELKSLLGLGGLDWLDFALCLAAALLAILLYILGKKKPETRSPEPEKIPEDSLVGVFFFYSL